MVRLSRMAGVAIPAAGLVALPLVEPPAPDIQAPVVQLTSGADPLGGGTAFVMGPSGFPFPPQRYADTADALYLQPHGFGGATQVLFTPEGLYPATGVKSLPVEESMAQGQQILYETIMRQIAGGAVDPEHPVVVFGFSQSSSISSLVMSQLADQGVPSDLVHFMLVGDPSNPTGGLGVTAMSATPSDLYPTDVYTSEYDFFADFPRYPLNLLADLNAVFGVIYSHATYLVLTPEQIAAAIQLPTSAADTLTNYYMMPAETLPLLTPLLGLPVLGQPLYDLAEPDLHILVNLGYGSITEGWAQGPADVPTGFGLFPTDLNPGDVLTALGTGLQQGISNALSALADPDTYRIVPALDSPALLPLVHAAYTMGLTDEPDAGLMELLRGALSRFANFPISDATLLSPPADIINALTGTIAADYATLLPLADGVTALLTGNPLDAAMAPVAVLEAAGGTLVNLVGLIPGI